MKCPVCGFEIDSDDCWAGDMCLRCALTKGRAKTEKTKKDKKDKKGDKSWKSTSQLTWMLST